MNPIFKECEYYDKDHDCCKYYSDYGDEPVYQPCLEGPCIKTYPSNQDKL